MLDDSNFLKQYDTGNLLAVLTDLPAIYKITPVATIQSTTKPCLIVATSRVAQLVGQIWSLMANIPVEHVFVKQFADFQPDHYLQHTIIVLGSDQKLPTTKKVDVIFIQPDTINFWSLLLSLITSTVAMTKISVSQVHALLQRYGGELGVHQPAQQNVAKQLAYEIIGKTPIIYATPAFLPLATKWQYDLRRLTQRLAWADTYSASQPNELLAWAKQPFNHNHFVAYLDMDSASDVFLQEAKRLSGRLPHPHLIAAPADSLLDNVLFLSLLSDFVATYTACLYHTNLARNNTY